MLVLPDICQCAANFQIGNDEAGRFLHKYASKMESGDKNVTRRQASLEPLNF
jgi:hypothetical protein